MSSMSTTQYSQVLGFGIESYREIFAFAKDIRDLNAEKEVWKSLMEHAKAGDFYTDDTIELKGRMDNELKKYVVFKTTTEKLGKLSLSFQDTIKFCTPHSIPKETLSHLATQGHDVASHNKIEKILEEILPYLKKLQKTAAELHSHAVTRLDLAGSYLGSACYYISDKIGENISFADRATFISFGQKFLEKLLREQVTKAVATEENKNDNDIPKLDSPKDQADYLENMKAELKDLSKKDPFETKYKEKPSNTAAVTTSSSSSAAVAKSLAVEIPAASEEESKGAKSKITEASLRATLSAALSGGTTGSNGSTKSTVAAKQPATKK